MSVELLLIATALIAVSGVPGLFLGRRASGGQRSAAVLNIVGSLIGGAALAAHYFQPGGRSEISLPWSFPWGSFSVGIDGLSLIFLIPIFLISALGSIYGLGYWRQHDNPVTGRQIRAGWGIMTAGMAMVVIARDGVLFLLAWEMMALAGFFLIETEEQSAEVHRAAWVYLVASHVGSLCLFGFFLMLRNAAGGFALWPGHLTGLGPAVFVLGAVGFGVKAGLVPLHVWLPGAHANAPSHVSALFSGIMIKMGIYGLVRLAMLEPQPPVWWGAALLAAGVFSGVVGIAMAAGQSDLKKLLAYSSIENMGIIVMGLGLALLGRAVNQPAWVVLGLAGALLHTLNHSLFKPLLFMGAGSILHATGTRQIDLLGGLGKLMPRTFVLFTIGAAAICALPPLNGFVGEVFIYLGFFRTATGQNASHTLGWAAVAAPALALIGAMSVAAFVKLVGMVFEGSPRSELKQKPHDPGNMMLGPMAGLAACCVLIGLLPICAAGVLQHAISEWMPVGPALTELVPFGWLSAVALVLVILVGAGVWLLARWKPGMSIRSAGTWDCGYARPTARMQYNASSFSQPLVELLAWAMRPRVRRPRLRGAFPTAAEFAGELPELVLDRVLTPVCSLFERLFALARPIQSGPIQVYLLYVAGILLALLVFA